MVQIDAFDEGVARELLRTLPAGPPEGFDCVGVVCSRERGARREVVGPRRGGRPAVGYVTSGERTAAVQDLDVARRVEAALRP